MYSTKTNMDGLIYLEDGTVFKGIGFGGACTRVGELVFNISMTGYQKILTDPSYEGQIINMTYPLIGNYGICSKDNESDAVHASGVVIKDLCMEPSNSNSEMSLDEWLKEQNVPGVFNVDTRKITKIVRSKGTIKCVISTEGITIAQAKQLCESTELRGNQMKSVSTKVKYSLASTGSQQGGEQPLSVAVLDYGVKTNILNCLRERGCDLTIYPYGTSAEEIIADKPDGIFLTNGPGDPDEATEAIEEIKKLIQMYSVPMFGICMGHQLLSIALGGKTYKLKYGHRGCNHGVFDKNMKRSFITSQNHGYAVNYESLILKGMEVTHINLNDGTVEGMEHRDLPIYSVQFHPESSPGPNDNTYLFDKFVAMMKGGEADA